MVLRAGENLKNGLFNYNRIQRFFYLCKGLIKKQNKTLTRGCDKPKTHLKKKEGVL